MKMGIEKYILKSDQKERKGVEDSGRNKRLYILKQLEDDPDFKSKINPELLEGLKKGYSDGETVLTFDPKNPFKKDDSHIGSEYNRTDQTKEIHPLDLKSTGIDSLKGKEINIHNILKEIKKNTEIDPELEEEYQKYLQKLKDAKKWKKEEEKRRRKQEKTEKAVKDIIKRLENISGEEEDVELQKIIEKVLSETINASTQDRKRIYNRIQKYIRKRVRGKFRDELNYYAMGEERREELEENKKNKIKSSIRTIGPIGTEETKERAFEAKNKEIASFIEQLKENHDKPRIEIVQNILSFIAETAYYLPEDRKTIYDGIVENVDDDIKDELKDILRIYRDIPDEEERMRLIHEKIDPLKTEKNVVEAHNLFKEMKKINNYGSLVNFFEGEIGVIRKIIKHDFDISTLFKKVLLQEVENLKGKSIEEKKEWVSDILYYSDPSLSYLKGGNLKSEIYRILLPIIKEVDDLDIYRRYYSYSQNEEVLEKIKKEEKKEEKKRKRQRKKAVNKKPEENLNVEETKPKKKTLIDRIRKFFI